MKKYERVIYRFLLVFFVIFCFSNFNIKASAEEVIEVECNEWDSVDFSLHEACYVSVTMEVRRLNGGMLNADEIEVAISEREDYGIDNEIITDTFSLANGYGFDSCEQYTPEALNAGNYTLHFRNNGVGDLLIYYTINTYPSLVTRFTFPAKEIVLLVGEEKELNLNTFPFNGYMAAGFSCNNDNIISYAYDSRFHKVYIEALRAGSCTLKVKSYINGQQEYLRVIVKNPNKPKLEFKTRTMHIGESCTNVLHTDKKVKWSTSNKRVATVNKNGKIKAVGIGKATITARVGTKKYTCKITVKRQNPDFYAQLYDYNTRGNYFSVVFYNNSNKSITVYSSGAKVMHVAYKTYDRNLKQKKRSMTIKPHTSKTVRFYVKGRVTWYDYERYTLQYKFKFDNVTYTGRTWDEESIFKKGKKWYSTYQDEEYYRTWLTY